MRRKIAFFLTIAFMGALGWIPQVVAKERYLTQFNTKYGTSSISTCTLCHPDSLNKVNSFGSDFATASIGNHTFNAALESRDSDRDGFSNLAEIQARTFPGDASSKPAGSDTTPPVISSFSIPSTWNSLTVPITSFVATDNVGVTGYALSESGSAPSSGWSGSAPSSYTFSSAGNKTLYAWARDAAGNISSPQSAQLSITLDSTPPPLPEPLVGRWIRLKIFLGNGHGWSELGLVGEGKRLTTYLHLESWDPQSRILHGLLYLQLGSDQKDLEKDLLTLPLDSLVTSSSRRKFWATSQFTEDPSTLFSVKFEGRFVKGELKWGILRGKHKPEDGRQSRAWFWLRGKLIEESQVPEDILNFLEVQKDFSMNRSCNYG